MNPGVIVTLAVWLLFVGWLVCEIVGTHLERREGRRMERLRVMADRKWSDIDEHDAALVRTLEYIQALPVANPWDVAGT